MENKLKVWIARDKDGILYVHFNHQLIKDNREWRMLHSEADAGVDMIKFYTDLFPSVQWEDAEPTEAYITLAEPQEQTKQEQTKQEQKIDWEQRRYEIAKDILSAQHGNYPLTVEEGIDFAVEVANMLIAKLKEQSE